MTCKNIPLPGLGAEVVGREVLVALFDGDEMVSNVTALPVVFYPDQESVWHFADKVGKDLSVLLNYFN